MKTYHIHRAGDHPKQLGKVTVKVVHSSPSTKEYDLSPKESQEVRNHSPDGFEFGYGGSGPAQLALAILMDYTGKKPDEWEVPWKYQDFKFRFIAPMDHPGGVITGTQIDRWLRDQKPPLE